MLNDRLPRSELEFSLKEYWDTLNFILREINPNEDFDIGTKDMLGKLHHALNISSYKKPEFRAKLLKYADKKKCLRFFQRTGMPISSQDDQAYEKSIEKASKLAWGYNNETRAFIEEFEYDKNLMPSPEQDRAPEFTIPSNKPLRMLKEYQSKIFYEGMRLVENPWVHVIIKMPTGAGKTRTALEMVSNFLNNGIEAGEKRQVVWLADREELCEQAIISMQEIWSHLGKDDLHVYRVWGKNNPNNFEPNAFIVATYQKLNNLLNSNNFPKPELVVADEAHNVIARTHKNVIRRLEENGTRIVGLTATPLRGMNSPENTKLREYFNDQIIEIDSGDMDNISYLQSKGYLAYCDPETIESNREFILTQEQRRKFADDHDLPPALLDEIAADNTRNIAIAKRLKELIVENKQILYFAPNLKQSKLMCAIILALGGNAAHVDGNTPMEYRRDVISKFKEGTIKCICNVNVFSVGFDAPNIDVVFIARPTRSIVLHQQMIGRGMRGPRMGGTEQFRLIRILDILPSIELADEYFADLWRYKNLNI